MLDIRRLQALQAVARHGTIAAAARALHFTAPAISQQLAALERDTNVALFHRTARSIRLTEDGILLAAHADIVLSQLESASNALASNRAPSGPLRISAFPTVIECVVADALQRLHEVHPDVVATVIDAEPDASERLMRSAQVDVAIVHHYDFVPRTVPGLVESTALYDEAMLLVQATASPAAPADVELGSMREQRWIVPPVGTTCHEHVQRACGAAGFVPTIAAQCNDYRTALTLVRAGLGVALIPSIVLTDVERRGVSVVATTAPLRRHVSIQVPIGRPSPVTTLFVEAARATASQLRLSA